ncbi:nuclear transport factor 2 family protein [Rhodococcus sp. CH91]|uniref:nuclear transport factor 2 family protein n=1 Tax=Rhodococcus sp. CH91 TaxID=2910256 RepID=UPI001F4B1410|nr:nuclear transport factor 2 family protein [Rhodococcus sp. CH91]
MTRTDDSVDAATLACIHQLYGRQSHLIDGGSAREWAETFTPDGEFCSPSYPAPVTGAGELEDFAERFHAGAQAAGEVHRHVVTDLAVYRVDDDTLRVRAYLQIVATARGGESRLVRFTSIDDRVVRIDGEWRIARRVVSRDDS